MSDRKPTLAHLYNQYAKPLYDYLLKLSGQLEEKYQYIKDEEFIVYGAVVTGPVKE